MSGSPLSLLSRFDSVVGNGLETAVRRRHRRRLARLGWGRALVPKDGGLWATGEPAPRDGCSLEVLIDGAEAFRSMAREIEAARDFVHITGWHVAPHFELERDGRSSVLGQLLAEAAERLDVRVLVWAGSPIRAFHPTRAEVRDSVEMLTRRTRIRCEIDPREHPLHCHHEKTVVVDGKVAFVGGIDITDFGGDRYDTSDHPARRRLGWHDVSTRLRGPAVADVNGHFALRWRELTGDQVQQPQAPPRAGKHEVQVVRTVAEDMYRSLPRGDFRILESYVRAISSAQRFIYLENQFLWAPEIVQLLADRLRHPPCDDFQIVILLPAKANNGQDDTIGQLGVLADADAGSDRLLAVTTRSLSGHRDDRLYVHAKVGIVDDGWLTVGSANLNAHSLFNDTEMNVVSTDPELARATRVRLWAEHLQIDAETIAREDPRAVVIERWRPVASEQLRRKQAGEPATHRLIALPGVSRRSRRLFGPLAGLVDDG